MTEMISLSGYLISARDGIITQGGLVSESWLISARDGIVTQGGLISESWLLHTE